MITVCHPVDDLEVVFLRAALEAERIPHLIVGEHFGSLYPGMQVPFYNERSIRVPQAFVAEALRVVDEIRSIHRPAGTDLVLKSKLRMLLEGLLFGWVIPGGQRKPGRGGS